MISTIRAERYETIKRLEFEGGYTAEEGRIVFPVQGTFRVWASSPITSVKYFDVPADAMRTVPLMILEFMAVEGDIFAICATVEGYVEQYPINQLRLVGPKE
jgi:hypothetical protein